MDAVSRVEPGLATTPPAGSIAAWPIVAASAGASVLVLQFGWGAAVPLTLATVAVLAWVSPAIGLIAFALLAPFDGYIAPLRIYKDLLWSDLLMAVVILALLRRGVRSGRSAEFRLAAGSLVGLGAMQLVSAVTAGAGVDGVDNALRFAYFIALFLVVARSLDGAIARRMAAALVAGMVARVAYESVPYFSSETFVLHPSYQFGNWTSNPNTLAGLAAPVVAVALALAWTARTGAGRAAGAAAALVVAAAVVMSFSKSAWLACAAAAGVWALLTRRTFRPRHVGLVALAGVIAFATVPAVRGVPGLMLERWNSAASSISNQERLKYIRVSYEMAAAHPLFGVGLERFPAAYLAVTREPLGPDDPHNAYLHIASELGLPSLGLYLLFLTGVTAAALRQTAAQRDGWAAGLVGALAALLVFQLFSSEPWSSRVYWVLVALAVRPTDGSPGGESG